MYHGWNILIYMDTSLNSTIRRKDRQKSKKNKLYMWLERGSFKVTKSIASHRTRCDLFPFTNWIQKRLLFWSRQKWRFIPNLPPRIPTLRHPCWKSAPRWPITHHPPWLGGAVAFFIFNTFPIPRGMPSNKVFENSIWICSFKSRHVW